MAYINVDEFKRKLIDEKNFFPAIVARALDEMPTADVVPRSEYDKLEYILIGVMHSVDKWLDGEELEKDEVNRAITMREKTLRIIENLKADVAREIFTEIDKRIASLEYRANTPRKTVKVEELKAQCDWILHEVIPKTLAELKEKYIGDKQRKEDEGK